MDVLIENTTAQLHGIGKPTGGAAAGALVQPNLVTLKPGLNKVNAEDWKVAKDQEMVKRHISEGNFVEMKEVDSLGKLNPSEAEKYIDLTVDTQMLLEWKGIERRQKITRLIDARLDVLGRPEKGTVKPDLKGGKKE